MHLAIATNESTIGTACTLFTSKLGLRGKIMVTCDDRDQHFDW